MMTPEETEWFNAQVAIAARTVTRKFANFVEQADLQQELWEWLLRNDRKLARWRKQNDDDGFERLVGYTLTDEATIRARRAKAAALGYNAADEFFYSKGLIEDLLPVMFNKDEWLSPPTEHGNEKSGRALNEGNNWLATLSDVSYAFDKLDEADRELLSDVFEHDRRKNDLAEHYEISRKGIDHRIERAIKRLWRHLGGPKWLAPEERERRVENPVGTRKVMSNAAARAVTDNSWDPS